MVRTPLSRSRAVSWASSKLSSLDAARLGEKLSRSHVFALAAGETEPGNIGRNRLVEIEPALPRENQGGAGRHRLRGRAQEHGAVRVERAAAAVDAEAVDVHHRPGGNGEAATGNGESWRGLSTRK